jgi:c(7)-type cytochrome triheme protein
MTSAGTHRRRVGWLVALVAAACGAVALVACSVPPRIASVLFEGVPADGKPPPPEPVVRNPRRPPYHPPRPAVPAVTVAKVAPKPALPDWDALYKKLPHEPDGTVDWDDAFEKKLIAPRPGIEPKAAEQTVFDYNVELVPQGLPAFKVVFPHKPHTEWLGCPNCHTEIFQMKRGADQITMAKILAGEFCGRCHGKVSFALTSCARCHTAMPK